MFKNWIVDGSILLATLQFCFLTQYKNQALVTFVDIPTQLFRQLNQCSISSGPGHTSFLHLFLFKVKVKKAIKVVILFLCPKVLLETQSGSGLFLDESLLEVEAREPIKIVILFYAQKSSLPTVLYSHWLGLAGTARPECSICVNKYGAFSKSDPNGWFSVGRFDNNRVIMEQTIQSKHWWKWF